MKRNISIPIHLKRFFLIILISTGFIIVLSVVLVGFGEEGGSSLKSIVPRFGIKTNDVKFNENGGVSPKIKVYITKENKVVEMYLEEYVRGVVAAEMPVEFGIEALKAQAVTARTFALAHMEQYGGKKYKSNTEANVCDTVQCQVFINKEDRLKTWTTSKGEEYWNKITEATKDTSGEVLMYDEKIIDEPLFFAISGGRTENALDVFKDNKPYLQSVESPGEEVAPKFKSVKNLSYSEFIRKINTEYTNSGINLLNVRSEIEIKSRNESGSVKEIRIAKITISGVKFRNIMGLNSTNFKFNFNANNIEISCIGYGHGVGMSQWGANAMAKQGKDYKEILKHYYRGVEIRKIN